MSTIPTTADRVLAAARSQLGVKESPFGSNRQKYGRAFGMDGVAWCAIFVWWVFRSAGADLRGVAPGLQYTPTFVARLDAAGWPRVRFADARPGDVVFFDFPDSVHRVQHVGIVETRSKIRLTTIEGNTSTGNDSNGGQVMRRLRKASVVKVIFRPPYQRPADPKPSWMEAMVKTLPTLKRGDRGEHVQTLQALLVARSHPEVAPGGRLDGEFGPTTEKAVRAVQKWGGVKVDGEVGPKTWPVLLRVHQ